MYLSRIIIKTSIWKEWMKKCGQYKMTSVIWNASCRSRWVVRGYDGVLVHQRGTEWNCVMQMSCRWCGFVLVFVELLVDCRHVEVNCRCVLMVVAPTTTMRFFKWGTVDICLFIKTRIFIWKKTIGLFFYFSK